MSDLDLPTVWDEALARLEYRGFRTLLQQQARLEGINDHEVVIVIPDKWLPTIQLREKAIAAAFSRVLARVITIRFVTVPSPPPPPPAVPPLIIPKRPL